MLVSSTSINAATATTTPISQGLNLGRHGSGARIVAAPATAEPPGGAWSRFSVLSAIGSSNDASGDRFDFGTGCCLDQDVFHHRKYGVESAAPDSSAMFTTLGRELQQGLSSGFDSWRVNNAS